MWSTEPFPSRLTELLSSGDSCSVVLSTDLGDFRKELEIWAPLVRNGTLTINYTENYRTADPKMLRRPTILAEYMREHLEFVQLPSNGEIYTTYEKKGDST